MPWQPSRRIDQPEPGYFRLRLVTKGPWVPAQICCEGGQWFVVVNGAKRASSADPFQAQSLTWVWERGHIISRDDYETMLTFAQWAERHNPVHPAARPNERIDLNDLPPAF